MTRTVARFAMRLDRGFAPRLFALLAVVALVAPSVASFAGPEGLAWLPEHGHIFLNSEAAARPHSHPWDHPGASSAPLRLSVAGRGGDAGVIFTTGDLGATDSTAAIALPAFALPLVIAWQTHAIDQSVTTLHGTTWPPLVPPPQG